MNWKKSKLFFQKIVRIIFCLIIFLNHTEINIYFARLVLHGRWIACRIINTDTITVEDVSFPTCTFLYTDCSTHGSHIIAGGFAWTATLVVFHVFWALRFIWLTKTVLGKNRFFWDKIRLISRAQIWYFLSKSGWNLSFYLIIITTITIALSINSSQNGQKTKNFHFYRFVFYEIEIMMCRRWNFLFL